MMAFLNTIEQHHLQAISLWFYKVATSRVQTSVKLAPKTHYFTWLHGGSLAPYVLAQLPNEKRLTLLTPKEGGNSEFSNFMWYSCQVGRDTIFQVEDAEVNCRVLLVEATCFSV